MRGRKFKLRKERGNKLETKNLSLEKNIRLTAINQVWHTDITYIPTDEGWLYLAGVMDGFSKRLVGYAMQDNMRTDLVIQALRSAVTRRRPGKGLIHHGDKGSQYMSYRYQHELASRNMLASFTGTGACLDNAVMESFWAVSEAPSLRPLKKELVYPNEPFKTRDEARLAVFEYIEVFYNRERLHSSLLYKTPERFELTQQPRPEASLQVAA